MGEAIHRSMPEGPSRRRAAPPERTIIRFAGVERLTHWLIAADTFVLMVTGAVLYFPALSSRVSRRLIVENVHTVAGVVWPVILAIAYLGPWGAPLRGDVRRLAQIAPKEWQWFRASRRRWVQLGKFNPGQKLNAIFVLSFITVLFGTGLMLLFPSPFAVNQRTGATFVHDWLALALAVLVVGHMLFALAHREELWSMVTGRIDRRREEKMAPLWLDELEARENAKANSEG